jgi:hypothetical protein
MKFFIKLIPMVVMLSPAGQRQTAVIFETFVVLINKVVILPLRVLFPRTTSLREIVTTRLIDC